MLPPCRSGLSILPATSFRVVSFRGIRRQSGRSGAEGSGLARALEIKGKHMAARIWTCDIAALWLMLSAVTLAAPEEVKTSKERLSDKASDNQRVDNCNVPVERRGPTPRPDCPDGPGSPVTAGGRT